MRPIPKVFPERNESGEVVYHGEVWVTIQGHEISIFQLPQPAKREATTLRRLEHWIRSKACSDAVALELSLHTCS